MKLFSNYYHDGKIKHNNDGFYYYEDKDNYLFSKGIYKTKIKEEDLPEYFVKLWLYPRYEYISLKNIKDIHYRPNFFTNHWRKDDLLYISFDKELIIKKDNYADNYDVLIYGPEIDHFITELEKYGFDIKKLSEIRKLMEKKNKWFKYWQDHNWDGNYSYTSKKIWDEILSNY